MPALHQIQRRGRHVITQVVKTELIVRTKRNIASVGFAALVRVGVVLVNTIHCQSVEHIQRTHPLRVALCQIIVHRYHMHALMRQRVQKHRQRCHQRLTFTRRHLGYLTLVKHHAAYQLHIIVHHIPSYLIAAGCPVVMINRLIALYLHKIEARICCKIAVLLRRRNFYRLMLCKPPRRTLHDGKRLWQNLQQHVLVVLFNLLLKAIHLVIHFLALVYLKPFYRGFQLTDFLLLTCHALLYHSHQRLAATAQRIVRQFVYLLVCHLDFLHVWHHLAHIFLRLISKQLGN